MDLIEYEQDSLEKRLQLLQEPYKIELLYDKMDFT